MSSALRFVPTLPAAAYSSAERFDLEFRTIFRCEWLYALHVSQLPEPGSYQTFDVGPVPLLIVRGSDQVIRAFYNVCVHRGHVLAVGAGRVNQFTCPYHAWTYRTDGVLRAVPGLGSGQFPCGHDGLRPVEVIVRHGFVFVRIEAGPDNFDERFGGFLAELEAKSPALDRLRFARRFTAEVAGNWKVMVENYLECYHCTPTHPALADLMCIPAFEVSQSAFYVSTRAPALRPDNAAYRHTPREGMQTEFSGWGLWPNLTFNIFPGQQNLLVFHMMPVSAERTIGYCDYFFVDGAVDAEAQALMDWEGNVLEREDNELIVAAHKGLKSGALEHGVFVVNPAQPALTEGPLAHFNSLVARAVGAR
ncbi:MAG: aromatic ring-hydroxylating dioxygenase subunit alpha [Aestuariivirga sp.]|uniref:aromatic ring-hydroxylating oxygenase subunit alpha n=1 Tax=Aestuariivirga sp. TaxID=2650926 RepID=UPI0025C11B79|nr:aromatic ring-hydroxylating dioxygenase subunit alpha [Aestuariivirga sp.]MCA3560952.1 aromatic ring-hydroxylating dioxygenase subunit alpha [Aestuariivirga sp.]